MKVKVAEALSYGLPVIGTSHAWTGYEMVDKGKMIADTASDFISGIEILSENPDALGRKEEISGIFQANLSMDSSRRRLGHIIDEMQIDRRPCSTRSTTNTPLRIKGNEGNGMMKLGKEIVSSIRLKMMGHHKLLALGQLLYHINDNDYLRCCLESNPRDLRLGKFGLQKGSKTEPIYYVIDMHRTTGMCSMLHDICAGCYIADVLGFTSYIAIHDTPYHVNKRINKDENEYEYYFLPTTAISLDEIQREHMYVEFRSCSTRLVNTSFSCDNLGMSNWYTASNNEKYLQALGASMKRHIRFQPELEAEFARRWRYSISIRAR